MGTALQSIFDDVSCDTARRIVHSVFKGRVVDALPGREAEALVPASRPSTAAGRNGLHCR